MKSKSEALAELYAGMPKIIKLDKEELMPGKGNPFADVLFISGVPSQEELKCKEPFAGRNSLEFNELLMMLGLSKNSIYTTNAVKFKPSGVDKWGRPTRGVPLWNDIMCSIPFLLGEIEIINPQIIVTLGNVPLRAVTNNKRARITTHHGLLFTSEYIERRIFPLYSPSVITHRQFLKEDYLNDVVELRRFLVNLRLYGLSPSSYL